MNSLWETIALITFVGTQDPATVLRVLATRLTATQAEIIRTLDAVDIWMNISLVEISETYGTIGLTMR